MVVVFELGFVDVPNLDDDLVCDVQDFGEAFGVFELDLGFLLFCVLEKL